MPPSDGPEEETPAWDQEEADWLVGRYALVGVTYLEADGETLKTQAQYHGRIVSADRKDGIRIDCEGRWAGSPMCLPPDLRSVRPADPGNYKLRSTGEVVVDPDVLMTWTVTEPVRS